MQVVVHATAASEEWAPTFVRIRHTHPLQNPRHKKTEASHEASGQCRTIDIRRLSDIRRSSWPTHDVMHMWTTAAILPFSYPDCTVGVGIACAHRTPARQPYHRVSAMASASLTGFLAASKLRCHGCSISVDRCLFELRARSPPVGNWIVHLTLPRRYSIHLLRSGDQLTR